MNNITLAGRLTKQPELKVTSSGTDVLSFTIAVNRAFAKQGDEVTADFINCVAWRKTAVFINQYFDKGDGIVLRGRLESRKWVDNNGNNRVSFEVQVENVEFPLGKKSESNYSSPVQQTTTPAPQPTNGISDLPIDDDLPF
ncbi:MAG: single-stranded DNA-binding protein [Ruminococcus sp.]